MISITVMVIVTDTVSVRVNFMVLLGVRMK